MQYAFRTDIGKQRIENQDSVTAFMADEAMFGLVCDGMGGQNGGRTASTMAVDIIKERIRSEYEKSMSDMKLKSLLQECINYANAQIYEASLRDEQLRGMGTTCCMCVIRGSKLTVMNVGDSRLYVIDGEEIRQITHDQTLAQSLYDKGEISLEDFNSHPGRHMLMQAVGTDIGVRPDFYTAPYRGEVVLICSDGLTNMLDDFKIRKTVIKHGVIEAADKLIEKANEAGGYDNISVVIIQSGGAE